MKFNDDYNYVTEKANKMIEKGLADFDLHSIRIDTFISDAQKEKNSKFAKMLNCEEWSKRCNEFENSQSKKIEKILDILSEHFIMYQYKDTGILYCNHDNLTKQNGYEWDLYCNFGNKRNARLNFNNQGKTLKQRYEDLNKIKKILKDYEDESIIINIQYTQKFHIEELNEKAKEVCSQLKDSFVNYNGMTGKIKPIQTCSDGYYGTVCQYGFFKKGSKKKYYPLTNMDMLLILK